jgi:hypothetical protein
MLGELLGEEKGKITMRRVVRSRGKGHKMEVTMQTTGTLAGVEFRNIGTYTSMMRPGGFLFGQGQGMVMTKDGDAISWVGQGTGRLKPGGGISFRGAVFYETSSTKLARLNGLAVAFEHEVDADDNCSSKLWEWK